MVQRPLRIMAESIEDIRREVARLERLAGAKISRLRKQGVEVAGSEFDPRRSKKKSSRYNTKQARAYISALQQFNGRATQFVGGANRSPIPKGRFNAFKNLERLYNKKARQHAAEVSGVYIPQKGMTIGQRKAMLASELDSLRIGKFSDHKMYRERESTADSIASASALEKLIAQKREQIKPSHERKFISQERENARKMSENMGMPEVWDQLQGLTDRQFNLVWSHTDLPTHMKNNYENLRSSNVLWIAEISETSKKDIDELITWARTL